MNHDRLFKELLTAFFFEFLELFFPALAALVDRSQEPEFLDKETYTQSTREMDLVVRLRLLEGEVFFIVHVEHQAQDKPGFPARMFRYFTKIWDRYQLPIFPIAIFSFPGRKLQPQSFCLEFHELPVLHFRYMAVQLNQLNWSAFVNRPNPVASALMARMKIRKRDRPAVKVQCLRLLATLRLDKQKSRLIAGFVDSYLKLNPREMRIYEQRLENLPQEERQTMMQMTTSWEEAGLKKGLEQGREQGLEQGREQGREQGVRELLALSLERRFGERAAALLSRLCGCDLATMHTLQEQLIDGSALEQLEQSLPAPPPLAQMSKRH